MGGGFIDKTEMKRQLPVGWRWSQGCSAESVPPGHLRCRVQTDIAQTQGWHPPRRAWPT